MSTKQKEERARVTCLSRLSTHFDPDHSNQSPRSTTVTMVEAMIPIALHESQVGKKASRRHVPYESRKLQLLTGLPRERQHGEQRRYISEFDHKGRGYMEPMDLSMEVRSHLFTF